MSVSCHLLVAFVFCFIQITTKLVVWFMLCCRSSLKSWQAVTRRLFSGTPRMRRSFIRFRVSSA